MTDAGFFKGTSADQDSRFSDKNKKLMKTMKFADNIDKKIDMKKIRLELMRPYITNILSTLTSVEDEVMVEYVFSQLEEKQHPDGKLIQIMMTGFLGKTKARTFMGELWSTLLEAQNSPHGIPAELIELKREEMQKKKVEENKINASVNKYKEEIERSLNMDRRAPAVQHQQTSVPRARTPPRVIKDTVERKDAKKPDTDSKQASHRHRRSRTRSRSRSPKYQSSSARRQRNHSRERSPARRHDNHKTSRTSERDDEQRKSSRRFREKTPDTVPVPTEEKMDSKLKALDIASEAVKAPTDEATKNKMEVDQSPKTEAGSDSSSSGSSDSESGSGSSESDSGSGSSSSSGSESDGDSSASSTTSSKKLKKKRKQPQVVGSEAQPVNGNGVKCAKVEGDSDVHTATNGSAKADVEALNGNGEAKEVAPLQRILQAEKRKESDRSSHRSGRDVDDDGRRRRRDEEDRRRYEEDRRRRDEDDRRRRHEQEARRYEEDRRRRDEEDRRREKEERRREEDRRLRYEEDRRREERRHREKEHEKQSRSHRNRSDSDSDDSEPHRKSSSSRHKKKKSSRDESDRKKSKKSKKSRSRERDHESHRSSKTDAAEMEKSLREKALESLASKRSKEESNSN